MKPILNKAFKFLGSRVARNIYFWVFILYSMLQINIGNEAHYHYGFLYTRMFWMVFVIGCMAQMLLAYGNNLFLVPRLLAVKKYGQYLISVVSIVTIISLLYTIGLKYAKGYIDIDNMQQVGFVSSPVSTSWSTKGILSDLQTYLFGNIMWVFVFTMAWYMNDYSRQQKIAEQAKREQAESELYYLKSQLNPHFLFNTLNNLYGLSLKQSEYTPEAILKLSSILRYLLYESNIALVSVEKEKEIMQAYMDLELLRLAEKDKLRITIETDQPYLVPPLLWLPVLENAFKHGTRIIGDEDSVDFTYRIKDGKLKVRSVNNFKPNASETSHKGIGLELLKKRLVLLYPNRHQYSSEIRDGKYITEVSVELNQA